MGFFEKISDWIRSLSDYRQPVYDPDYDGSSWKKWAFISVALILGIMIYFAFSGGQDDRPNQNNISTTSTSNEEQKSPTRQQQHTTTYEVLRIIDGDTIDIKVDSETQRVRLIGVDTPEKNHPSKPVECFANEASNHLSQLISGKSITVETDSSQDTKDKYSRYLYYIYLDGQNINNQMISDGYAYEYTYNAPYKYQSEFKMSQKAASDGNKGLWSPSSCNGERVVPASTPSPKTSTPPSKVVETQPSNCDSNYSPCVPNVSYDLDCGDISFSVRVIGNDRHRFDKEGDGYGCEGNG